MFKDHFLTPVSMTHLEKKVGFLGCIFSTVLTFFFIFLGNTGAADIASTSYCTVFVHKQKADWVRFEGVAFTNTGLGDGRQEVMELQSDCEKTPPWERTKAV